MAIPRFHRYKRKSERYPIKGWVRVDVPYRNTVSEGVLVDISQRGIGVRIASNHLNSLLGQTAVVTLSIPTWERPIRAIVTIERHVQRPNGRIIGMRFLSIHDDALALIDAYTQQLDQAQIASSA